MVSLADINQERSEVLRRVLSTVLRSTTVTDVFAQVIDGLPKESMYENTITMRTDLLTRTEPSEQAKVLSRQLCNNPEGMLCSLSFNLIVAQLYQECHLFSPSFNMHLLELVAIAVHDIAGNLYATFHPDEEPAPTDSSSFLLLQSKDCISLSTKLYITSHRYPRGLLDVVGYWTEVHVFGGVVVFDRGPQEGARHCYGAYLHPRFPEKLFQLSEPQLQIFSCLGSGSEEGGPMGEFALPFVCEQDARTIHHVAAFEDLNIYRDRYERQILPPRAGQCPVVRLEDHPELKEFYKHAREMYDDK